MMFAVQIKSVAASLKITEIYPAPADGGREWVEIFNDGGELIDITAFSLADSKNNKLTFDASAASPSGYILAGGENILNNSGDDVVLKNEKGEIIDSVSFPDSITSDKSYSFCNESWMIVSQITKNTDNSPACILPTPTVSPSTAVTLTDAPPNETDTSIDEIYISEVMVNPSENGEWIEIFNNNDFHVSLKNWFIDDAENSGSAAKPFSLEISAKSYGVFELTSAMFNNDSDSVRILNQNSIVQDSFTYYSSSSGKSLGKIHPVENSICLTIPTKGFVNGVCVNETPSPTATPTTPPERNTPTTFIHKLNAVSSTPSPKKTAAPTNTKKIITPDIELPEYLYESDNQSSEGAAVKPSGQVLGSKSALPEKDNTPEVWKILSLSSIGISSLTIIKIFLRIKYTIHTDV